MDTQQRYWYRVRAYGNGQDTAYSPKRAATTVLPGVGQAVAMEKNATTATVAWWDNSANESGFDVFLSADGGSTWTLAANAPQNSMFTDISGLSAGTSYRFRVRAHNSVTTALDSPQAPLQPAPPTSLAGTSATNGVTLSWTDASAHESGFIIQRAPASQPSNFIQVGQVSAGQTTFTDTSADPWITYVYRVRAVGAEADSVWSDPARGEFSPNDPPPPADLTATAWFDYNIPAVKFRFSQDVTASLSGSDLLLEKVGSAEPTALSTTFSYNPPSREATFVTGLLPNGNYRAVISKYDVAGLDADAIVDFHALGGDANADRIVEITDLVHCHSLILG